MPLRTEKVVINGEVVVRYNGNSPAGTRESWHQRTSKKGVRSTKITSWRKRKAQEAEYTRRYLSG